MKTILTLVLTLFVTSFAQASVALVETYGDRIVTIREPNMITVKTVDDCSLTLGEDTLSGLMAIIGTGRFGHKKAKLRPTVQEYPVRTIRMTGKGTLERN